MSKGWRATARGDGVGLVGKLERPLLGMFFPDLLDVEETADPESEVHVDGSASDGPIDGTSDGLVDGTSY